MSPFEKNIQLIEIFFPTVFSVSKTTFIKKPSFFFADFLITADCTLFFLNYNRTRKKHKRLLSAILTLHKPLAWISPRVHYISDKKPIIPIGELKKKSRRRLLPEEPIRGWLPLPRDRSAT